MLVFVLFPAVLTAEEVDMLEYFGEEVISCMFIKDLRDTIRSGRDSVVWEIWNNEEVKAFRELPEKHFKKNMDGLKEESGIDIKEAFDNFIELKGGIGIGFYGLNFEEDIAESLIVMTGIPNKRKEYFRKTIRQMFINTGYNEGFKKEKILGKDVTAVRNRYSPTFYIFENGKDLLISFSRRPMEIAIRNANKKKADPELTDIVKRFRESSGTGFIAYGSAKKAISYFEKVGGDAQGDISEFLGMLSQFGIRDIDTVAVHTAFRKRGFHTGFIVSVKPEAPPRFFKCKEVSQRKLKKVPASAASFSAFTINPEYTYDTIIRLFSMFGGNPEMPEYKDFARTFKEETGVSVRDDLVKSLSGEILIYSYSPTLFLEGDSGIVVRTRLKGTRPVRKLIEYFIKKNAENEEIAVSSIKIKGKKVYTLAMPRLLVHPTAVINGNELIISTTKDAAVAALSAPEKSILENPKYTDLEKDITSKKGFFVSYTDAHSIIEQAYSVAKVMAHVMHADMGPELIDLSKIPTAQALTRNLFGAKHVIKKTGNEITGEAYAPIEYFTLNAFFEGFVLHFCSIMIENLLMGRM